MQKNENSNININWLLVFLPNLCWKTKKKKITWRKKAQLPRSTEINISLIHLILCFVNLVKLRPDLFRQSLHPLSLSPLSLLHLPSTHPVFLHVIVVDIDQLQRILYLVGTPGPELSMKISSESVSVKKQKTSLLKLCHSAPSCLCLRSLLLAWFPVWFIHYLLRSACVRSLSNLLQGSGFHFTRAQNYF